MRGGVSSEEGNSKELVRIQCIQSYAVVALVGLASPKHGHVPPLGQRRDGEGARPGQYGAITKHRVRTQHDERRPFDFRGRRRWSTYGSCARLRFA